MLEEGVARGPSLLSDWVYQGLRGLAEEQVTGAAWG